MKAPLKERVSRDDTAIFTALKAVFSPFQERLRVQADTDTEYTLVTQAPTNKGQSMYFGSVRLGKAYVSFHLMPLYFNERLTGMVSAELKKRMQGKTCFNFRKLDAGLFAELGELTRLGFEGYERRGLL